MNILMVCTNLLFKYDESGSKLRIDQLADLCAQHNQVFSLTALSSVDRKRLHALPIARTPHGYYFRQGTLFGYYLATFTDLNPFFFRTLRRIVKKEAIDVIMVTAPYGIPLASMACRKVPIIYDAHAVQKKSLAGTLDLLARQNGPWSSPAVRKIARATLGTYIRLIERLACRKSVHIAAVSEADRQAFINEYHVAPDRVTVIPPFLHRSETQGRIADEQKDTGISILFHGNYDYPPNREAVRLITEYIAPEVAKRDGRIRFVLAGTNAPVLERGNIRCLGYVQDLEKLMRSCDIAIAPLLEGGGIRTKMLDYMSAGLPVIATRKSLEAINARDGEHAIILDSVDDRFTQAILDMANDPGKRQTLGRNGQVLAEAEYGRDKIQLKLGEILSKVAQQKLDLSN
ncbi:MAG: glycosyltransferase family 4 protein [Chloroflexi bacterium]|nr:glycosyltransferase family 4 protein [Chloroflexota bacterium]